MWQRRSKQCYWVHLYRYEKIDEKTRRPGNIFLDRALFSAPVCRSDKRVRAPLERLSICFLEKLDMLSGERGICSSVIAKPEPAGRGPVQARCGENERGSPAMLVALQTISNIQGRSARAQAIPQRAGRGRSALCKPAALPPPLTPPAFRPGPPGRGPGRGWLRPGRRSSRPLPKIPGLRLFRPVPSGAGPAHKGPLPGSRMGRTGG